MNAPEARLSPTTPPRAQPEDTGFHSQDTAPGTNVPAADAPPPDQPTNIGRYTIRKLLGRGGMGEVYLAHDPELDRPVALKVPRFSGAESGERFLREARAAAAVDHVNLCTVYDAGRTDGVFYLAMAYVPGESLAQHLAAAGPLAPERAVELALGIARGMAEAHRHGIIHRDLKPGNVLLNPRGAPVVTDFGLARRSGAIEEVAQLGATISHDPKLTQAGAIMGTPAYLPPEQARGEVDRVGPPADIYALGAILYEMLTGRPPHQAERVADMLGKIQYAPIEPPSSLRPDVPAWLDAVVLRALQRQPEDRFATMEEFAAALQPRKPRHLGRWLAAALAGVLLVVAGAVFYIQTDYGTIEVRLSDPAAAVEVSVNGASLTVTDKGRVTRLRAGTHGLEVKGPDFETVTRVFKVKRGETNVLEVELKPKERIVVVEPRPVEPMPLPTPIPPVEPEDRKRLKEMLAQGRRSFGDNQFKGLGELAEEILRIEPKSPGGLALRAVHKYNTKDVNGARIDSDLALKLNPETPLALWVRASWLGPQRRTDDAIAELTKAMRLDPKEAAYPTQRTQAYLDKNEYRQVIADAALAIELGFAGPIPNTNRAAAYVFLGDYEKALADLTIAVESNTSDPRYLVQRAAVYAALGQRDKADKDFAAARQIASGIPRLSLPPVSRGPVRKTLGTDDKAKFDAALKAAEQAADKGDLAGVLQAAMEAQQIDPTAPAPRALRVRIHLEKHQLTRVPVEAADILRFDPENAWGYLARGVGQLERKLPAAGISDLTIAARLVPTNAWVWYHRGRCFQQRGDYQQALADLSEALRLKPELTDAVALRATCRLHLGEYDKALTDLTAALKDQPKNVPWLLQSAAVKAKLGDTTGAGQDRARAVAVDPKVAETKLELPTPLVIVRDPE